MNTGTLLHVSFKTILGLVTKLFCSNKNNEITDNLHNYYHKVYSRLSKDVKFFCSTGLSVFSHSPVFCGIYNYILFLPVSLVIIIIIIIIIIITIITLFILVKNRSVDQDIDCLVLIGDQYKKHKKSQ